MSNKKRTMRSYSTSEQTKSAIVHAAGELVAENGFSNVSTRAVAKKSGANIGSIHYHFGGKDKLFSVVVMEAIHGCMQMNYYKTIETLDSSTDQNELARVLRMMVADEIHTIFKSGRPQWQFRVIYQLMQRDDHLFDLARKHMLEPELAAMARFFKLIDPEMDQDQLYLNIILLKMPIYAHVDYIRAFQKMMGVNQYSDTYLKQMEEMLATQAQRLLGLPER